MNESDAQDCVKFFTAFPDAPTPVVLPKSFKPKWFTHAEEWQAQHLEDTKALRGSPKIQAYRQKDRERRQNPAEYNAARVEGYAEQIWNDEQREVRMYRTDAQQQTENRQEKTRQRVAKHRANMTPEQREERNAKRRADRAAKKMAQSATSGTI